MSNPVYSEETSYGTVFYDEDGNLVGHSERTSYGTESFYDADGSFVGHSESGIGGTKAYYDQNYELTGYSGKDFSGGTFYKNEDGSSGYIGQGYGSNSNLHYGSNPIYGKTENTDYSSNTYQQRVQRSSQSGQNDQGKGCVEVIRWFLILLLVILVFKLFAIL